MHIALRLLREGERDGEGERSARSLLLLITAQKAASERGKVETEGREQKSQISDLVRHTEREIVQYCTATQEQIFDSNENETTAQCRSLAPDPSSPSRRPLLLSSGEEGAAKRRTIESGAFDPVTEHHMRRNQ